MTDVAKLAGVSTATVSRVVNDHPQVTSASVQAVQKAMAELNYSRPPRRAGHRLPTLGRDTIKIAFLVFGDADAQATPAFEQLLQGASCGADAAGLELTFAHIADGQPLPPRIFGQRVDGLLLHGSSPTAAICSRLRQLPTVWLMGNHRRPDWGDHVAPDRFAIGEMAARYLLERGHKRLAFLSLDRTPWPAQFASHAFLANAAEAGVGVDQLLGEQAATDDQRTHRVARFVERYLHLSPRPTGLFIPNAMQAAILQPALQAAGIALGPGAVEIICCNSERPLTIGLTPRPAEIDIRGQAIGRRGIAQLAWRLEHGMDAERLALAVEPVIIPHE